MGPLELGVIALLVALFFGPKALPKIANAIGRVPSEVQLGRERGRQE